VKTPPRILLTFNGAQDPISPKSGRPGPILTLMGYFSFDEIHLFCNDELTPQALKTKEEISSRHGTLVHIHRLNLPDPTDYEAILDGVRSHLPAILADDKDGDYFIFVSPGTPQIHTCWFLLAAAGEVPAQVLHVKDPDRVKPGHGVVTEVNPRAKAFPILGHPLAPAEVPTPVDLRALIERLGIVGRHPAVEELLKKAALAARGDSPVLIVGETGTGKELLARFIHEASPRRELEFHAINCGAFTTELLASELFGHVKGAFTGALGMRTGWFERAGGGTLFLDEVSDMPMEMQVKLLRVLQEGVISPVGSTEVRKVDVRVVAASNRDPVDLMRKGRLREDLFYRLGTHVFRIPPLRERRSDIGPLAEHILKNYHEKYGRGLKRLTPRALRELQRRPWPGNIRELRNVIQASYDLCLKGEIDAGDLRDSVPLPFGNEGLPEPHEGFSLDAFLEETRRRLYDRALEIAGGNQTRAAALLGVSPQAVSKYKNQKSEI